MSKRSKAKTNNPNPDYVPPHGFGGISCSEFSDALGKIFCQQRAPVDTAMSTIKHLSSLSCPNCGAPVRGGECEYCGTVFSIGNDVDLVLDGESVASAVRRHVYEEDGNGRQFAVLILSRHTGWTGVNTTNG